MRLRDVAISVVLLPAMMTLAAAQEPQTSAHGHESPATSPDLPLPGPTPWMLMYDGMLFGFVNHQGGPRGGNELKATNWLMGMASRRAGTGVLQLTGMLSLDPATATPRGYREIFQVGESYKGAPLVDRQHPHDLLMQASIAWRVPLDGNTALTLTGAPVGEPALGPTAFMHRASAAENLTAPLGHHTLDSTHISMGVLTAGVQRGPWTIESSLFHGGEPDDNRWDLVDPGPLDSWSARMWFAPSQAWQFQVSHGFLSEPEPLEPGNVRRTTASAEWFQPRSNGFSAVTIAYGRNDKTHGAFNALLAEATERRGRLSAFGRFETLQVETAILAGEALGFAPDRRDLVTAMTAGGVWDLARWKGFETGVGADLTFYGVPDALQTTHGDRPVSFHVFLRVRPPASHMGRMWNMRMGRLAQ
jgi:hypothetical protein